MSKITAEKYGDCVCVIEVACFGGRTRSHQVAFECVDILWLHSKATWEAELALYMLGRVSKSVVIFSSIESGVWSSRGERQRQVSLADRDLGI